MLPFLLALVFRTQSNILKGQFARFNILCIIVLVFAFVPRQMWQNIIYIYIYKKLNIFFSDFVETPDQMNF